MTSQQHQVPFVSVAAMERVRSAVYLSVCLSLLTSPCQGQRSADQPGVGLTTNQLVSRPSSVRIHQRIIIDS